MKITSFILFALFLGGCASNGPGRGSVPYQLAVAQLGGEPAISFWRNGTWYPNQDGRLDILVTSRAEPVRGALVVVPDAAVFLEWNSSSEAFVERIRISFADITSVSVSVYGRYRELNIFGRESTNSFVFTRMPQGENDAQMDAIVAKLMRRG